MDRKDDVSVLFLAFSRGQTVSGDFMVIIFITLKGYLCDSGHIKIDFCDDCHIISAKTITPA
ncbi:hypothetical protein DWG93_21805 [Escherichia coli]|nr:hypothetical protein [Escherichia coli]EFO1630307.1 hypothetical protein [Escherichia coli]EGE0245510.1 hypothetical protein [Escherichia coli]PSS40636.1 hypothetical protein BEM40_009940 [Escherichia sp. MOD1-EC5451]